MHIVSPRAQLVFHSGLSLGCSSSVQVIHLDDVSEMTCNVLIGTLNIAHSSHRSCAFKGIVAANIRDQQIRISTYMYLQHRL